MDHDWIVEVKDDKGTAITTGATVALVPSSTVAGTDFPFAAVAATHAHKSGGVYEASQPIAPVVGDWVLIVRVAKKSPVVQPLKMRAKGKVEIQTLPSPKTVATVGFSAELKSIGKSQLRRSRFKVEKEETKLTFADGSSVRRDTSHTKLKVSAKNGFATPGQTGHLYEIHVTTDESLSIAVYVQDDGQKFTVTKDAAGKFTVLGSLMP
jgi:hypothetical protein